MTPSMDHSDLIVSIFMENSIGPEKFKVLIRLWMPSLVWFILFAYKQNWFSHDMTL